MGLYTIVSLYIGLIAYIYRDQDEGLRVGRLAEAEHRLFVMSQPKYYMENSDQKVYHLPKRSITLKKFYDMILDQDDPMAHT